MASNLAEEETYVRIDKPIVFLSVDEQTKEFVLLQIKVFHTFSHRVEAVAIVFCVAAWLPCSSAPPKAHRQADSALARLGVPPKREAARPAPASARKPSPVSRSSTTRCQAFVYARRRRGAAL